MSTGHTPTAARHCGRWKLTRVLGETGGGSGGNAHYTVKCCILIGLWRCENGPLWAVVLSNYCTSTFTHCKCVCELVDLLFSRGFTHFIHLKTFEIRHSAGLLLVSGHNLIIGIACLLLYIAAFLSMFHSMFHWCGGSFWLAYRPGLKLFRR